jgi:hypothetical protein
MDATDRTAEGSGDERDGSDAGDRDREVRTADPLPGNAGRAPPFGGDRADPPAVRAA